MVEYINENEEIKELYGRCYEDLIKINDVEQEEKRFKRKVLYEGYMDLGMFDNIGKNTNKAKIVYDPERTMFAVGIYEENRLKYVAPFELDSVQFATVNY